MAFRMNQPGDHGVRRHRPMSDINVTPFVDVMLVLLVVFMVTAPLLTVGVQVDLPKANAPTIRGTDEPLAVTINREGRIYLDEVEVTLETLVPKLQAVTGEAPDQRIFVRGDNAINYGRVLEVMGTLNAAGFHRVALVAQPPKQAAAPTGQSAAEQ